jgi:hypothetical protein
MPELVSGCGVSRGKLLGVGSVCISLQDSLLAVAVNADEHGTDKPGNSDRGFDDVKLINRNRPTVGCGV